MTIINKNQCKRIQSAKITKEFSETIGQLSNNPRPALCAGRGFRK